MAGCDFGCIVGQDRGFPGGFGKVPEVYTVDPLRFLGTPYFLLRLFPTGAKTGAQIL